jgi:hypothetical protein
VTVPVVTTAEFLAGLFAGCAGWLEIRLLPRSGASSARSVFFPLPSGVREAAAFAAERSGREHVFFGVYPRAARGGRDASAVRQVQLLYADLDADHFAGGVEEIDARLAAFSPPPSAVVASGGGRHAYWLLDRVLAAAPGDGHRQVQDALWGIADALGVPQAKNAVHDVARVLRVPGTANIKPEYGPAGAMCEVLLWEPSRRYPPSAFREFALRGRSRPGRAGEAGAPGPGRGPDPEAVVARLQPSPAILELIRSGTPRGQRSEADQKVIVHLLARGATREEIGAIFRNPAWRIGDKYREKGRDGDRYLLHSIKNAEAWLSQHEQSLTLGDFNWASSMALKMLPKDLRAALLHPPTDPGRAVDQLSLVVQEWANRGVRPSAIRLALAYYAGDLPLRILRSALERGMPKDAAKQRANTG